MIKTKDTTTVTQDRVYHFKKIEYCNMCGASTDDARVLGQRLNQTQGSRPGKKHGISVTVCRCVRCGLVFADPLPIPRSIDDHYGLPPEEYWNSASFSPEPGYFLHQVTAARRLLGDKQAIRALDIGIGLGKAARVMEQAGFTVHGIEPSEPFYRKALEQLGGDNERYQLISIEDAQFCSDHFDFVTFGAVLEHIYDPAAALAKAFKWVRPGGIVHAEVPSSDHLIGRLINTYYRLIGSNFVTNISPMHPPFHLHEFTLCSFRENGLLTGYTIAEHHYDVCSIYHLPSALHPPLRFWMERTQTGMQLTVFLRKPGGPALEPEVSS